MVAACLVDAEAIYKVAPYIQPDDFFREKNGWIFDACIALWHRNEAINQITVAHELARRERLEQVGGIAYLSRLVADLPTVVGVEYYAQIVARDATYRRLISAAGKIAQTAYEGGPDLDGVLNRAETLLMALRSGEALRDFVHIRTLLEKYLDEAGNPPSPDDAPAVIRTGFIDLDTLLGGLKRSDLILLAARPSVGKCLAAGTTVVLSDGSVATIEQICRRREAELLTLGQDGRLRLTRPAAFMANGVQPVYRLTTRLGRTVACTLNHPFLTIDGWKPVAELQIGHAIAVPRRMALFGGRELPEHQAKLLGYLLGDGGLTGSVPKFTNANPNVRDDFLRAIDDFGGLTTRIDSKGRSAPTICVRASPAAIAAVREEFAGRFRAALESSGHSMQAVAMAMGVYPNAVYNWFYGRAVPDETMLRSLCAFLGCDVADLCPADVDDGRKNAKNRLTRWLESLGLWGCNSHTKFIPACVFEAPKPAIALVLNRLFATDGWATVLSEGQTQLGYATVSERFARQIQHLLLRFGVIASLRQRTVKYRDERRAVWQIDITDGQSIQTFVAEIGIFGKEEAVHHVSDARTRRRRQTNRDLIPIEIWKQIANSKGTLSWGEVSRRMGFIGVGHNLHVGTRAVSRQRLARFAEALDDPSLRTLAESDIYWDRIVSLEYIGEQQVYDLTIPETENFVANDIIVHNSALAMSFARNAAVGQKAKVAVFNLEMSGDQLAQRLLSAEASVDSTRLRLGEHTEAEERRIMHAMGILAECDIFIDDSPVVSIGELRGKVRRLQQEKGLDLLIIDYLQLMQGGDHRSDNRVQEISFISRSLKNLARELNVPIVALSQLSRAVESRKPPIPMMSDLRESGCLAGDSLVALASGELAPIESLVGQQPEVVTLDGWQVSTRRASRVWRTGNRPVLCMRTRTGRSVRATGNHRFRTIDGWIPLQDLRPGDRIAIPRRYPEPSDPPTWDPARIILLAHLLGDGCYVDRQPLHYTSKSMANLRAVAEAACQGFGVAGKLVAQETWHHLYLSASANKWHPNPIRLWLRELAIDGQRSFQKVVPSPVFGLPSESIALFLRHIWTTDGSIYLRKTTHGRAGTVYYATSSPTLAMQIQHLLVRLGIQSRIKTARKGDYRLNYHVHVMGKGEQLRFAATVGAFGEREQPLAQLMEFLSSIDETTNVDTIPTPVWTRVRHLMRERGITQRRMTALRGTAYGGTSHFRFAPSRAVLEDYATLLDASDLKDIAQSDVFWDAIESIEPDGDADVFDMTVPDTHNFVANGIVAHNSLEQDADVVMFIYREDYYTQRDDWQSQNPEQPGRSYPHGVAQVIVAKHRNGPVGTVDLRFQQKTAKFEDLYAREEGR